MPRELEEQMDLYSDYLLKLAYVYVKDRQIAEDIVQEVFIQFYFSNQYEEQGKLKSYLTTATVNRCKNYLKSWAYRKMQLKESFSSGKAERQDALVQNEERSEISRAIFSLAVDYRAVLFLYYYEEKRVRDIAGNLGLPENTVKTRLRKARQLLKEKLPNEEWEVLRDESFEGSI